MDVTSEAGPIGQQMTENPTMPKAEENELRQALMVQVVHKRDDGGYVVTPTPILGLSYLVNDEQLRSFEPWFVHVYKSNRPWTLKDKLRVGLGLVAIGFLIATWLGLLDVVFGVAVGGPLLVLVFLMKIQEAKAYHYEMIPASPINNAPRTTLGLGARLKMTLLQTCAWPLFKAVVWGGGGLILMALFFYVALLLEPVRNVNVVL